MAQPKTLSTPRLSEAARHLVFPTTIVSSVYPRIEQRLATVGVRFDPWQRGFGSIALGLDEHDTYAATVGGVVASIPRQVGKTFTVGNLLIGLCLEFPGSRAVWTSHHGQTTKNTLQTMEGMVRKPRMWPHVLRVYTNNNDLRIVFKNGSVIMFGAREHGFGRGMDAIDFEVFDEAQKLSLKALEDMVPATNQARHEHGALLLFIGTPPRPIDDGEMFIAKRGQALAGNDDDDMVYVEFSADADADPDDRSQWPIMNPSYPARTPLKSMLRMRKNLPDPAAWRREAMGIWDEVQRTDVVFPMWLLQVASAPPEGDDPPAALGVDMSHDRVISIAGVWKVDDDNVHLELVEVDVSGNTVAAVDWLAERAGRTIPVVIDGMSPAAAMIPALKARRVRVITTGPADMGKACGGMADRLAEGRLWHAGQKQLDDAMTGCTKRPIGTAGAWGLDRRDPDTNIAPAVSAILALFGVMVAPKPRSNRAIFA